MQMYKLTGNKEFLLEAISQLKKHAEKLEDPETGDRCFQIRIVLIIFGKKLH